MAAHKYLNGAQQTATATTKAQAGAIDQLGQKLKGQASAQADTATGKIKAFTTAIEDQAAAFGNKYGPALQVAGQGVAVLGAAWTGAKALHDKFKGSVDEGAKTGETAGKKAGILSKAIKGIGAAAVTAGTFLIGLDPIVLLIIAAVLALIAVGYLIYRNWGTIWGGIKRIVKAVFDWLKNNWPLLLAILTGPIGLAVLWIVDHWNGILEFFKKLPGRIASIASGMWERDRQRLSTHQLYYPHLERFAVQLPARRFGRSTPPASRLGLPNIP